MIVKSPRHATVVIKADKKDRLELEVVRGVRKGFEVIHVYCPPGCEIDAREGHVVFRMKEEK